MSNDIIDNNAKFEENRKNESFLLLFILHLSVSLIIKKPVMDFSNLLFINQKQIFH